MYLRSDAATQVEPTRLKRIALAKRVGVFLAGDHSSDEMLAVTELAQMLSKDIELMVRSALAFELRQSVHVPKDLAIRIAQDVEDVASPFLKSTPVLGDEELADLVPRLAEFARVAVAKRENLGDSTVESLIQYGDSRSAAQLVRNTAATLTEDQMNYLHQRFEGTPMVIEALASRVDLPIGLVERMVNTVTLAAKEALVERYGLSVSVAKRTSERVKRSTMFQRMRGSSLDQVRAFVTDLRRENRLSDILIIDAARSRVPAFVEAALALESGLTMGQTKSILQERAPDKVIPLLRGAGIKRDNMAELIRNLADCYKQED